MANPTIQFKRGQAANVGLASFKAGEPGFTNDKYDFYIGVDGTADNQQFFGSSRYWEREDGSSAAQLKFVDKDGSNSINFQTPNSLAGITTWILPDYSDSDETGRFLKITSDNNNLLTLDWAAVSSGSFNITADSGTTDTFNTGETLTFAGTASEIETTVTDNQIQIGLPDNVVVGGGLTATTFTLAGVAVTAILDEDDFSSNRADALATQQSIKQYIANNSPASSIDIDGDSGTASVSTGATFAFTGTSPVNIAASGAGVTFSVGIGSTTNAGISSFSSDDFGVTTGGLVTLDDAVVKSIATGGNSATPSGHAFTIAGTNNEIVTSGDGSTVTIALPDDVTIGNDLTITGNLFVRGSTTQVEVSTLTVDDPLIAMGTTGGGLPGSDFANDLGILMHYYSAGAGKTASVYWDNSAGRIAIASSVSDSNNVLTAEVFATVEIGSLMLSDAAGTAESVITVSGSDRVLQNIIVDAGTF